MDPKQQQAFEEAVERKKDESEARSRAQRPTGGPAPEDPAGVSDETQPSVIEDGRTTSGGEHRLHPIRLGTVPALRDDTPARVPSEQLAKSLACQRLVVGDDRAAHDGRRRHGVASVR